MMTYEELKNAAYWFQLNELITPEQYATILAKINTRFNLKIPNFVDWKLTEEE